MPKKIVLAYSGGLDTSAIMPWLAETYPGCEIVAFVADVGQGAEELEGIEAKALASGASSCHIADLKATLASEFIVPMVQSGAVYEGRYLLGTSIARPVIARAMAELALTVGADAVAHGCTGKGNDQVRFERIFGAIAPHLEIIAPWRIWSMSSREDLIEYIKSKNIPCTATREKIYSRDCNLWHISHEGGVLEDPWTGPPDDVWTMTVDPADAPDHPAMVRIHFDQGVPVAVDGAALDPLGVIEALSALGSAHGVGRIDLVENRMVGMKSRGCYETPGGTILLEAFTSLRELVQDRATRALHDDLGLKMAHLIYDGAWFTPAREALSAAATSLTSELTGEVIVKLFKGTATATQRRSPNSLYAEAFATFGADDVYDQSHAAGYIRLASLAERIRGMSKAPQPQEVPS